MYHRLFLLTRYFVFGVSFTFLCPQLSYAGSRGRAADFVEPVVDSLYSPLVKEYTTDERFLSPLVAELPDHPDVPSPREFLGYVAGAPKRLTYYAEIKSYMEALDTASDRVLVRTAGRSDEGREMIFVLIADESVLADVDRYAACTARLADPRSTDAQGAEAIIGDALPFYFLSGGLHSGETGSPEMLMELAYRLAVGESPLIRRIRQNVITMIAPVLEIDGRERMVDWYYMVTVDHTDWEDMPPRTPPYWGNYVLHDNNRDGIQMTQRLTRNVFKIFFDYHPQVMHDLHESVPFLYVSAGTGPYNDALDPITTSEWHWIANHEVTEMTGMGMPGVWTWGFYTGWWPGYLLWAANNHNSVGRFYETFGNAGASTFEREPAGNFAGKKITTRQWYRPWPPDKKVKWSFRDNINYMETGVLIALDFAAQNNKRLLRNFWTKGNNSLTRGRTEPPCAWVLPRKDQNNYELSHLVNNLLGQRIEVHELEEDCELGGESFYKGDFVVRMDQPYRDFAKSLLENQRFPGDAEYRPYDDVAWTLPLLYGVNAHRIDAAEIFEKEMKAVSAPVKIAGGRPDKPARYYIIPSSSSSKYLEARLLLRGIEVFAADTSFEVRGTKYARGSWIVPEGDDVSIHDRMVMVADSTGLDVIGVKSVPDCPRHPLDIPRLALFHTWTFTQGSGWARYTLDRAGVPYTLIDKDDLRDGYLRSRYDVILIPDLGSWFEPKQLVHGIDTKWSPLPYKRTAEFRNVGHVDKTDDMTGGMGFTGLSNLEEFIEDGGTLITLGAGSIVPVEFGLVRNVRRVRPKELFNPGSVLRAKVTDPANPVVYGYEELTSVFRGDDPLFEVDKKHAHYASMQYGTKATKETSGDESHQDMDSGEGEGAESTADEDEPLCLSGLVRGEEHLEGKPAVLTVPRGGGRVVIFSFDPLHRYLTVSSFGLVYNAILHWND